MASPDWKGAFAGKNDKVEVVETHIVTEGGFGFATESAYNQWKNTDNSGYITSVTRLVVMKYRKTGEMVSFLMTIVGDKEYLETKCFEMWDNTYLTKDKNFSGLVLFHSTQGDFVNGWRYTNGKVTHSVEVNFDDGVGISLKSGHYECTTYVLWQVFGTCTYLGITGEYGLISCNEDITYEYVGQVQQCTYVDDGGGGYNPPSGGNNPCNQIQSLANSSVFQSNMQNLNSNTTQNFETAYIMRNGEYFYVQGPNNMLEMTLPINSMNPADGYLHSHPQGALSIFSAADIKAIYDGYITLGINNLETFTAGVVTASGTAYLLKVEDKTAFMNFASANLKYQNNFDAFEAWYLLYGITENNSTGNVESGFVNLINNKFNTGLKLFKGNTQNFGQWNLREYYQGSVINSNCDN